MKILTFLTIYLLLPLLSLKSQSSNSKTLIKLKSKDCFSYLQTKKDILKIEAFDDYLDHLNIVAASHFDTHDQVKTKLQDEFLTDSYLEDCVQFLDVNSKVVQNQSLYSGWHLKRINVKSLPLPSSYIRRFIQPNDVDTRVFLVDSGVSMHEAIVNRLSLNDNYSFIEDSNCLDQIDPFCDSTSHGSHIAGLIASDIAGYNNETTIHSFKVFDYTGSVNWSVVLIAFNKIIELKKSKYSSSLTIVNLSLSGLKNLVVNDAINLLYDNNILPIVAAGNNGGDACLYSPSSAEKAISVGSTTINDTITSTSNRGTCVDVFAPGASLYSLSNKMNGFSIKSGTSMAAGVVSGFVSALASSRRVFTSELIVKELMKETVLNVNNRIPRLISDSGLVSLSLQENEEGRYEKFNQFHELEGQWDGFDL